jgi:signal transduction histidine kinase
MYAGLTGISSLVLFGVIFWSTARFMRHQIDDSVTSELDEILTDPLARTPEGAKTLVEGLAKHSSGFYYLLQNSRGSVQAGNLPPLEPQVGVREWAGPPISRKNHYPAIRGRGVDLSGEYLFVAWSTHQLHEMEEMVVGSFLWGLAASIVLALAAGVVMSGRLLRKIEAVSETSRDIIDGDLQRRVSATRNGDEFDHLANSINAMLDRIQTLMDDLRQVTTDIAHDMRTPLTRLRQRLEHAQRSDADADQLHRLLAVTIEEIDAILAIFAALLRIAQIESGARRSGFTSVRLSELLNTVVELYRPAADEKEQSLTEGIEEELTVRGDRELLTQLFANLLENAVLHAPRGAHIQVLAHREDGQVEISVTDNGPGIPESLRTKVLQRFFRLESSRTSAGNGLGLSLASAVVKLHDGSMTLSDNEPGLRVTVAVAKS